jgi:hypothetical protein
MTALATTVLADSWGWHHGDVGIGWWIVMMLGMVIFWGAMIALVVWLVRGGSAPRGQAPHAAAGLPRPLRVDALARPPAAPALPPRHYPEPRGATVE